MTDFTDISKMPEWPKPLDPPAQDEVEPTQEILGRIAYAIIEGSAGVRAADHAREFVTSNWADAVRSARNVITELAAIAALDRHRGTDALREENARLRGALRDASVSLWWAARQMKGNCNGSAVDAVNLAAENASSPASLTGRQHDH